MKVLIVILGLLSLALAQSPQVLPVEPLLSAPLSIAELSATSATLQLTTTLDVACVVIFGEDDSFGQMALDQTMGATAHADHLVIMRALEPDTDYVYRVQGSDAAGNLYASEIMHFRTLVAAASPDLGSNIARAHLGASIVAVSSNFGGGANDSRFGANNAIDEDADTEWSSAGDGNEAFITVALPEPTEVSGFGLWTRTMGSSAQIISFEVENEAGEVFGPFELPNASGLYDFAAQASGQRFTFRVTDSSGGNTGVVELAIYSRAP